MEDAIRNILGDIPGGMIFDSHYIISQLIKHHSDVYLTFASRIGGDSKKTEVVHSQIGQKIAQFESGINIIEKIEEKSWSENIHGKSSQCTAWKKL